MWGSWAEFVLPNFKYHSVSIYSFSLYVLCSEQRAIGCSEHSAFLVCWYVAPACCCAISSAEAVHKRSYIETFGKCEVPHSYLHFKYNASICPNCG